MENALYLFVSTVNELLLFFLKHSINLVFFIAILTALNARSQTDTCFILCKAHIKANNRSNSNVDPTHSLYACIPSYLSRKRIVLTVYIAKTYIYYVWYILSHLTIYVTSKLKY